MEAKTTPNWRPGDWVYRPQKPREIGLKRVHWEVGQHSGKGVAIVFGETEDNARFVAEAFAVRAETRRTPRQFAEERAELLEALAELVPAIERQLAGTGKGITPSERVADAIIAARAAITKARGDAP